MRHKAYSIIPQYKFEQNVHSLRLRIAVLDIYMYVLYLYIYACWFIHSLFIGHLIDVALFMALFNFTAMFIGFKIEL